jgi:hypothetical protein
MIISENKTWSGTITLTEDIQVAPGATLTISPGSRISGGSISVYGSLLANGTAADQIYISNLAIVFSDNFGMPGYIEISHAQIKKSSILAPTGNASYGSFTLKNSTISESKDIMYVWYPTGNCEISQNLFIKSGGISAGLSGSKILSIKNNTFVDQTTPSAIENWASYEKSKTIVQGNSFLSTDRVAMSLASGYNSSAIDASQNYFGTTDPEVINSMVLDRSDSLSRASVINTSDYLSAPSTLSPVYSVTRVNEAPTISDETLSVPENSAEGTVAGSIKSLDPEGNPLTYSILEGNSDLDKDGRAAFSINASTGVISVNDADDLDYEKLKTFVLGAQASDGALTSIASATVSITNVNEAPTISDKTLSISENSVSGTSVGSLKSVDPEGTPLAYSIAQGNFDLDTDGRAAFSINASTGAISVNDADDLDYEKLKTFVLGVQASDGALTSIASANISITNVNEPSSGSISLSGAAVQGQTLKIISTLNDPDGPGTATFQWLRDGTPITNATAAFYTLTSGDVGKSICARLVNIDGGGFAESKLTASVTPAGLKPGVTITRSSQTSVTTEQGGTVQFSVVLNAAPRENVTLKFASTDNTEGKVNSLPLTFTPQNWSTPQALIVQGADDYLNDGDIAYGITGEIITKDLTYNRTAVPNTSIVNTDDGQDNDRTIYGTDSTDYLTGANGNDRIYGKGDQDQIKGGRGNDRLYGQEDNDRLLGETGDDELWGGYDDDLLDGEEGNDSLFGEQGRDSLRGGSGNDYLDGGLLNDSICGGAGNDTYVVDSPGDIINDLGTPTDTDTVLVVQAISYTLPANVENASIQNSGNANLSGNDLNNVLVGNDGKNNLDGGAGNDALDGGAGSDSLLGGSGKDTLIGGAGNDTLRGGDGLDLVDFSVSGVVVNVNLNNGTASGDGSDVLIEVENIKASNGNDTLTGSTVANDIEGGQGNDSIDGGWGNDILTGGSGNDLVLGGLGADTLSGCVFGAKGGRGEIDTLTGGAGTDVFNLGYASGAFYDDGNTASLGTTDYALITDFTAGTDKFQLDGAPNGYYLATSTLPRIPGMALWAEQGKTDELIAIIRSYNNTVLTTANTLNNAIFV